MFISQSRACLPALFSATLLAATVFATTARADWEGQIGLGDEGPPGQAAANGFADSDGYICIGPDSIASFTGTGQVSVEIFDAEGNVVDQRKEAGPDIQVSIFSGFNIFPDKRNRIWFPDAPGYPLWWSDSTIDPETGAKWAGISLKMAGKFDCSQRDFNCVGPQDGKLSVTLYTKPLGYCN